MNYVVMCVLLVIALVCHHYRFKMKQARSMKKNENIKSLSDHQQYMLRQSVPTEQLGVFEDVLLPTLNHMADVLQAILVDKGAHTNMLDDKISALVQCFSLIKAHADFANSHVDKRTQRTMIVMVMFYRTLFENVMEMAIGQGVLDKEIESNILIKNIPIQVMRHLGSQAWRLYELKALIMGDINTVLLNQDIKESIISLMEGKVIVPVKKITNKTHNTNHIQINDLHSKFIKWLQRYVNDHEINQGSRLFVDLDSNEKNVLWISDVVLSDFSKKISTTIDALTVQLKEVGAAKNTMYCLSQDNKQKTLLAIPIEFTVEVVHPLIGSITVEGADK